MGALLVVVAVVAVHRAGGKNRMAVPAANSGFDGGRVVGELRIVRTGGARSDAVAVGRVEFVFFLQLEDDGAAKTVAGGVFEADAELGDGRKLAARAASKAHQAGKLGRLVGAHDEFLQGDDCRSCCAIESARVRDVAVDFDREVDRCVRADCEEGADARGFSNVAFARVRVVVAVVGLLRCIADIDSYHGGILLTVDMKGW